MSATVAPRSATDASRRENLAVALAVGALVLGAAAGLLALPGTRPLFGRGSIGEVAAIAASGTSAAGFLIAERRVTLPSLPWLRRLGRVRRTLNLVGLAAFHGVFSLLLTSVVFSVFASAFRGVALDRWAGAFWVAAACAACTYVCAVSAAALSSSSLSALLAGFVVTGVMVSAMSAPDPQWWRHHFSWLGTASGEAALTFNLTLLLAGFALVAIGDFLAHDLGLWAQATGQAAWRVRCVRITVVTLGALLIAVGLIPVDRARSWHDAAAQGIVVVFAVAIVAFPLLLPRLPGSFRAITAAVISLLVTCLVLWKGVHYLRTTAFEMGAAATVLVWLLMFARSVTAAVHGSAGHPGGSVERSAPGLGSRA